MDAEPASSPDAGSVRELWRVALPLVLSCGSLSLMYFVDRVFLTWASSDEYPALAAVLPAALLHWTLICVPMGTAQYVNTFVAQYEGAGRQDRVAAAVWQGVYLSLAAGVVFVAVAPFSGAIFALIGHAPAVQSLEVAYFSVFCFGAVPMTLSSALACFYSGRGATLVVMLVNFGMVAVNMALDYLLIFGGGPFPAMGIRGAALATVIAYTTAALAYAVLIASSRAGREYEFGRQWRLDGELFRRLLRYGLPNGLQQLVDVAGFAVFIFLVGSLGQQAMEATTLAFNANALAFIPMLGFGTAVMTLVGLRIGDGRPELAVRSTWLATKLCGVYMLAFAAIYVFLPDVVLGVYGLGRSDAGYAELHAQAVVLLRFVALYTVFDGLVIIFGSAVRGAGDTRFSVIFTGLAAWLLMVLPPAVAAATGGLTLAVCWWSCSAYIIVLGLGFLARFQAGHWKSMRVIEAARPAIDAPPAARVVPASSRSVFAAASAESPDSDAA
ncbi:MAG TPA: MATE family efflux transporter [Planctomycetaceae bacterium]|nr:MATE family efflux transporter [Planctomycetaceae bacterium]